MKREILCTLGPSSFNERVIRRLESLGVNLFRINLSHTPLEDIEARITFIRKYTNVPICLDTEGAQVRTGRFAESHVELKENSFVEIVENEILGNAKQFNLYPKNIISYLQIGDLISIDFNAVLVKVVEKESGKLILRVLNGGTVGSSKAITVDRFIDLPPLTEKDIGALEIGRRLGIKYVALSFASRAEDVKTIRSLCVPHTKVISKVESRRGLTNLNEIIDASDAILIDRGDLSREEPIERIPFWQKKIIRQTKSQGKVVYVATNLLESMISTQGPTRAEVNDVINTLIDGADGLVLAAETAIGRDPVRCASMIVKLMYEFENAARIEGAYTSHQAKTLLVEPHGGTLCHSEKACHPGLDPGSLPKIVVKDTDLMDCQQFAVGTYSPLTGFMNKETLDVVLEKNRLPSGLPWTMPIILQVNQQVFKDVSPHTEVSLTDHRGTVYAHLKVSEKFKLNLNDVSKKWFGTDDVNHPGVQQLFRGGECILAGDVTLIRTLSAPYQRYELTPAQSRAVFEQKGWNRVVGFHTRNVVHRAHEYIQMTALERTQSDGLYISPVVGTRRKGDFLPQIVLMGYQLLVECGVYPKGKVAIGCFATYPRFCGPREAVFTALCRKNMGCSHFIIGRNHAGVGDYYAEKTYRKLFHELSDLGIEPVFFDAVGFNPTKNAYDSSKRQGDLKSISGTEVRRAIQTQSKLPEWFMRPLIQNALKSELLNNRPIFYQ